MRSGTQRAPQCRHVRKGCTAVYYQYVSNYQIVSPSLAACPSFVAAMDIVGKRWNGIIVQAIAEGCNAFSEIARYTPGLSDTMLARRLRELEDQQLVLRSVTSGRPPAVHYSLTDAGAALAPVLDALTAWGEQYTPGHHESPGMAPPPPTSTVDSHPHSSAQKENAS